MMKSIRQYFDLKLNPPEFSLCLNIFTPGSFAICLFGLWIFILPKQIKEVPHPEVYGLRQFKGTLQFYWDFNRKITLFMPWSEILISRDVLTREVKWAPYIKSKVTTVKQLMSPRTFADDRMMFESPYIYVTRKKEPQRTIAFFYVNRLTHTYRIFKWLKIPFKRWVKYEISFFFKNEIGEQKGTHHGGHRVGTYEMLPSELENPFKTINRMNRVRRFE